jgi:transglutaminase-like putative cysteine protease
MPGSPFDLWNWVGMHIRYVDDGENHRLPEVWQVARETYLWRRGDCEDSAILLTRWLRAAGHDAHVVVGHTAEGGHAWVVLKHEGKTYLLETTEPNAARRRYPPLAWLKTGYHPSGFMFNEKELLVRRREGWTADYGSERQWYRLDLNDSSAKEGSGP